jgi:hypothetical protein
VLQHDAEPNAGAFAGFDHRFGARRVGLERLLEQDVLAGCGEALDERQVRARRRQDQGRRDRAIAGERLQIVGERKIEPEFEGSPG